MILLRSLPGIGWPTSTYTKHSTSPCPPTREMRTSPQHICDFSTPTYTRDDPPQPCITMCEGHRPKMFLWMLEQYMYILSRLCTDDRDGQIVLTHELLLLVCSRCCRKRGGGQGPHCTGTQPLDSLPACSRDTIEHTACSTKDTIALECLAWAVYDNQLGLGRLPSLSGMESYGQVLWHLVDKAFQGLQVCCLAHMSAMFKLIEKEKVKSVVMVLQKLQWPERYSMMRDMWREFTRMNQAARGWEQALDPEVNAMRWMKEHQHSYMDA